MPAHLEEIKRSAVRAGALTALTRAKAWISDLDPADIENGYPSIKEDGSAFDNEDLRALTREMHSLSRKLAEEVDLSFHQSIYDPHNNRVNTPGYETPTLILPIRKHTYAPGVDPSSLISDEAVFNALTGIDWSTTDSQQLGREEEGEPVQDDPQPSSQPEPDS